MGGEGRRCAGFVRFGFGLLVNGKSDVTRQRSVLRVAGLRAHLSSQPPREAGPLQLGFLCPGVFHVQPGWGCFGDTRVCSVGKPESRKAGRQSRAGLGARERQARQAASFHSKRLLSAPCQPPPSRVLQHKEPASFLSVISRRGDLLESLVKSCRGGCESRSEVEVWQPMAPTRWRKCGALIPGKVESSPHWLASRP